ANVLCGGSRHGQDRRRPPAGVVHGGAAYGDRTRRSPLARPRPPGMGESHGSRGPSDDPAKPAFRVLLPVAPPDSVAELQPGPQLVQRGPELRRRLIARRAILRVLRVAVVAERAGLVADQCVARLGDGVLPVALPTLRPLVLLEGDLVPAAVEELAVHRVAAA